MSDEKKIKALMKQAQKAIHSSSRDSIMQQLAKRRSIILRCAQKDMERGKDHGVEFGEGYGESTPSSVGYKDHEARQAGNDRHGFSVYDLYKKGKKVSGGHTSRAVQTIFDKLRDDEPKTESYLGKLDCLGKKVGKMARRLDKKLGTE